MESRRTRVTVPGGGDERARFWRVSLPVGLAGVAVAAVATTGDGGLGRATYLRPLVFGPAGPGVAPPPRAARPPGRGPEGVPRPADPGVAQPARAARARGLGLEVVAVPAIPQTPTDGFAVRALPGSAVHGHRPRPRRRGVLGSGGLPRRTRQPQG